MSRKEHGCTGYYDVSELGEAAIDLYTDGLIEPGVVQAVYHLGERSVVVVEEAFDFELDNIAHLAGVQSRGSSRF